MAIPSNLLSKQILIVDDVASMRSFAKAILLDVGFQNIHEAKEADGALKHMKAKRCDLIICDWNMPGKSGLDLLKMIRKDESLKSISFLMVTGSSDIEKVKEAISEGVTDYITKPLQVDTFRKKVTKALS